MQPNFNYIEFAIEMSTQAKDLVPTDIKQEQDYITNTVYLAVTYAGEKVCSNNEYSTKEKEFISQLVCEWAFHKVIDLLRAKIKKEYHKEIMLNILETALKTAEVCITNNIKQQIILKEVEKKIAGAYINSIEKLYNENLIEEEQLKVAYNQSNIDKMAKEYQQKKKNKVKYVKTHKRQKESDNSTITTMHGAKINKKAQKFIKKAYIDYYLNNAIIIAIGMYGATFIYSQINNMEILLNATVFSILIKPSFFIPAIIAIGIKDIIKYIFWGLSKNENEYLKEIEDTNPTTKGVKDFISPDSIKQRFKTFLFVLTMLGIAIFFLLRNILKNWILIIPIAIIYYVVSYKNSIPAMNLQDIILNKNFIIGLLATIITYNFIKNKKTTNMQKQSTQYATQNYFEEEVKDAEVSFQELTEFVDEMGEEKPFDYKEFTNEISEKLSKKMPNDIEENAQNKILKRVIDYALLSGDALENGKEFFTTSQKKFIVEAVSELAFCKNIDITRASIEEDLHDKILQQVAFYAYEIAKQGSIKSVQQEKITKAIVLRVNEEFIKIIKELHERKQISYETYLKAQNESYLDATAQQN